jgi:UrcA family protein
MNTTTTVNRPLRIVAACLFGVLSSSLAAAHAAAIDSAEFLQASVKFGDLDLSHPQGALVLYGRIHAAAKNVCSPLDGRDISDKMRLEACIKKAITAAVKSIDNPVLFAVYSAKAGNGSATRVASL